MSCIFQLSTPRSCSSCFRVAKRISLVTTAMPSTDQLHIIILDQVIGEKLVGGLLERRLRLLAVTAIQFDVEHLALAHARNAGDAQRPERALDRLPLGIEDAGLQSDNDTSLHDDLRMTLCDMGRIARLASRAAETIAVHATRFKPKLEHNDRMKRAPVRAPF